MTTVPIKLVKVLSTLASMIFHDSCVNEVIFQIIGIQTEVQKD